MKIIQFLLSVLAAVCASGMLYKSIVVYSPLRSVSIAITSLLTVGSVLLVVLTFIELKRSISL
ncbi:hypothetical protein [Bacteroides sp.]